MLGSKAPRGRPVLFVAPFNLVLRIAVMKQGSLLIICLSALLLIALPDPGPAIGASSGKDYGRSAQSYRAESRLRIQRDHHRGRSFSERRSRLRNPSYIRREERRRALSERETERRPLRSGLPTAPGATSCRTMTSVVTIEGRRALVSQRECIDAPGITHISPGTRRVVKFYDE